VIRPQQSKPSTAPGVELLIGRSVDAIGDDRRRLNISDTRLNQLNFGVVGDLGTGKTQLLKSLIYQIAGSGDQNAGVSPNILIFDYKRDYSSEEFVKSVGAKVLRPKLLPINIFDLSGCPDSVQPWLSRFKFFMDILDKIYSGIGPIQRTLLKRSVREAYEQRIGGAEAPTIYDVHANYSALIGNRPDSVFSIIDDLVDMELFTRASGPSCNFTEFLKGVVVVDLAALGQDDRSKNMLVAIMLNVFYEHMLQIPKRPYLGSEQTLRVIDSFLLVDEADNIMRYEFDVLRRTLLQGREFGVGVILASQYLSHFKVGGTDYREPLLSWFVHKVPNVTPQELSALGLTADLAQLCERVKSLPVHECLFKSANVPGEIIRGIPFYRLVQSERRAGGAGS
jgi:DNA helicase HerA-like ATPase